MGDLVEKALVSSPSHNRRPASGDYEVVERSKALPITSDDVNHWLSRVDEFGETKLVREFRKWVRKTLGRP